MSAHRPLTRTRIAVAAGASALALGGTLMVGPLAASAESPAPRAAGSPQAERSYGDDMLIATKDGTKVVRAYGDDALPATKAADEQTERAYGDDMLVATEHGTEAVRDSGRPVPTTQASNEITAE